MEVLRTKVAAERAGVTVQKFHRLAAELGIAPEFEGDGIRGPKFWKPRDAARIRAHALAEQILRDEQAAS